MADPEIQTDPAGDLLVSFSSPNEADSWRTVNDDVMGGPSLGGSNITENQLVFTGEINTTGGGFSSVRRQMIPGRIINGSAFLVELNPDDRTYRMIVQTDARHKGRPVSYQAPISSTEPGNWATVEVPFNSFTPTVFGRRVPAQTLDPAKIKELGFIIADGNDGPFRLSVRSIAVSS